MKFFTLGMPHSLELVPLQTVMISSEKKPKPSQFLQPTRLKPNGLAGWLMIGSLFFAFNQAAAQSLRDPTSPPPEAAVADSGSVGTSLGIESGAMSIIVRNGQPHLMIGTLLYAQGAKVGQVRIERITEAEIWLREGNVLRKVTQFPGVQRRMVTSVTKAPICASSSSNLSPPATPCVKVRP